ncbi:MAG: TIGR04282 family arsenosugar biosynthesis glycosyltransferase [Planctomycetota bacterium]
MSTGSSISVFAKRAVPGEVKTRLGRSIGLSRAAAFYRALARDTLDVVADFRSIQRFVFFSPADNQAQCEELAGNRAAEFEWRPQSSGDLGDRLFEAFREQLEISERALVIGTDCPLLDRRVLSTALRSLRKHDVVIGPARDGGYYLLGLRQAHERLFRDMPWSTEDVRNITIERAQELGLSVDELVDLPDVDEASELPALASELREAWDAVREGKRDDFPCRTFRSLDWELGVPPRRNT